MAVMTGITFFVVFLIVPERGLISSLRRRRMQKLSFTEKTVLFHLSHHEGELDEAGVSTLRHHLHREEAFTDRILRRLMRSRLMESKDGIIRLTRIGREKCRKDYEEMFG